MWVWCFKAAGSAWQPYSWEACLFVTEIPAAAQLCTGTLKSVLSMVEGHAYWTWMSCQLPRWYSIKTRWRCFDQDQNQLKASGVVLHVNLHLEGDLFSILWGFSLVLVCVPCTGQVHSCGYGSPLLSNFHFPVQTRCFLMQFYNVGRDKFKIHYPLKVNV